MNNAVALGLGALILLLALVDGFANGGGALLFLAQKFMILVDYVAFWR